MADARRFTTLDLALLLLVLALAAGARAGYLMTCADNAGNSGPLRVTDAAPPLRDFDAPAERGGAPAPTGLDALIHNVREHNWFGALAPFATREEQTAHVAPGYPYLVGMLGMAVGKDDLDTWVRWVQVGLGTLTAAFYFLFAWGAFRSLTVATLAGVLAAVHPYWVISTAAIDDTTLTSFALAGCLMLGGHAGTRGGAFSSLLLGLGLAGLALVRAAMLPFSFAMLVWFLMRSRGLPRGWLCALLAFLGFANGLAPWTVRNYQAFEEPVPITSSAYLHLWIGNNPKATGGPATEAMWRTLEIKKEGQEKSLAAEMRQTDHQPTRYAKLGRAVVEEVKARPAETVRRRLLAAVMFFTGQKGLADGGPAPEAPAGSTQREEHPLSSGHFVEVNEGHEMPAWLADVYPIGMPAVVVGMLFLAFLGWRWSYGWRWESFPAVLAMIWVPLPYVLSHAGGLSGPRLPLDGVLLCFAAFALGCFVPGVREDLLEAPGAGEPPGEE